MDIEEWELLPTNNFNDLDDDHGFDYILCSSPQDPLHEIESLPGFRIVPTKLLQAPIALEPMLDHESKAIPNDPDLDPDSKQTLLPDSVPSTILSFKKTKETEFADIKIDSPTKITSPLPQIYAVKHSDSEGGNDLPEKKEDDEVTNGHGGEKLNLWKIGLNRIGAICSFGVAAATLCVFFLGHNNIKICKNKNQMLRFQIYSDDNKRMKEFGNQAKKFDEAIFAIKGVPVVRAQLSFGSYYDGL